MATTEKFYWLITPNSTASIQVWTYAGYVCGFDDYFGYDITSSLTYEILPVLHLKTELMVNKGDGSSDSPYQLSVS